MSIGIPKSIFVRISLVFFLLVLGFAAVQYFVLLTLWERGVREAEQRLNWETANYIAERLYPIKEEHLTNGRIFEEFMRVEQINPRLVIYLLAEDGTIIASRNGSIYRGSVFRPAAIPLAPIKEFLQMNLSRKLPLFGQSPEQTLEKTVFSVAAIRIGERPGYLYVTLESNKYLVSYRGLEDYYLMFGGMITSLVLVILAGVLGAVLFYKMTKRFRRLAKTVHAFANAEFDQRIPSTDGKDEIAQLGREFNTMADRIVENISELERTDRLRREMLANIAHDIDGPLMVVHNRIERTCAKIEDLQHEEVSENLSAALNGTATLQSLTNELFELAKLDDPEARVNIEPFSLLDLLTEELIPTLQPLADDQGINLSAQHPATLSSIIADPNMIQRVLKNLIENGIRYTPSGGKVLVELYDTENTIEVRVSDSGQGIAEEEIQHVFDRFYRGRNVLGRDKTGSGIGLAIVKRILEIHNQDIRVESTLGQGTTFCFQLSKK